MKDTRFIELVNLYIDRQLSPAEAAELEHEIQTNPQRRHTYRQYCRMHRATKLVYESFRSHAEQQGESAAVGRPASIARLENRQRLRARWTYAAAGLAAAACVTFVVARNDFFHPSAADLPVPAATVARAEPAAPTPVFAPATATMQPASFAVTPPRESAATALVGLRNSLFAESDYAALIAAARLQEQRLLDLGQSPADARVSLFDDGVFETRPTLRTINTGPTRRPRVTTEFTAFQFQR